MFTAAFSVVAKKKFTIFFQNYFGCSGSSCHLGLCLPKVEVKGKDVLENAPGI